MTKLESFLSTSKSKFINLQRFHINMKLAWMLTTLDPKLALL